MFGPVLGDRPGFVGFGAGRYQLLAQHFVLSVHPASPGRVSAGVGKLSRAQLALYRLECLLAASLKTG